MLNPDVRAWASTLLAALIAVGIGAYDAFAVHAATFGIAGDVTLILAGLGALGIKTAFDHGVAVTPVSTPAPGGVATATTFDASKSALAGPAPGG